MVPTALLQQLGIKPIAEQTFRLSDGNKVVRRKGAALFKYAERGEEQMLYLVKGDSTLLGAFTLEALGLALDPLRRELKPLPMVLALSGFQRAQ